MTEKKTGLGNEIKVGNNIVNSTGLFVETGNTTNAYLNTSSLVVQNSSGYAKLSVFDGANNHPHVYIKHANSEGHVYPRTRWIYTSSQALELPENGNALWDGAQLIIMCWGAGGSGGCGSGSSGGGGGGGFKMAIVDLEDVLATPEMQYVVVGSGGGAQTGTGPGQNGGLTYVGNTAYGYYWCVASGGIGGGYSSGAMANGGMGGIHNSIGPVPVATAGSSDYAYLYGLYTMGLSEYNYGSANLVNAWEASRGFGYSDAFGNEAMPGIMGAGGGGGSANTSDHWYAAASYGGLGGCGGGGGAPSNPTGSTIGSATAVFGPGFNIQIPGYNAPGPFDSTNHDAFSGGTGANSTTDVVAGYGPGYGGGGGSGTRDSGAGGDGLVIVTLF